MTNKKVLKLKHIISTQFYSSSDFSNIAFISSLIMGSFNPFTKDYLKKGILVDSVSF